MVSNPSENPASAKSFMDFYVVEGRHLVVCREDRFTFGGVDECLKARVSLELRQVFWRGEAGEDINVFDHHRTERRGGIGDALECGIDENGWCAPIVVIAAQLDFAALGQAVKFERTCADGRLFDALYAFGCDDHAVAPREVEQHVAVGLGEFHIFRVHCRAIVEGDTFVEHNG